jgi:hypothetical protein
MEMPLCFYGYWIYYSLIFKSNMRLYDGLLYKKILDTKMNLKEFKHLRAHKKNQSTNVPHISKIIKY